MAYAKINSVTNANMAKVNSAAKAALGKIGSIDAPSDSNFTFTVNTENAGSATKTFVLPLVDWGTVNFVVDWGDDNTDTITAYNQAEITHIYGATGTYTVKLLGTIGGFRFNNGGDKLKIIDISNWGDLVISVTGTFWGCSNLTCSATDAPETRTAGDFSTTSFQANFWNCHVLTNIGGLWDMSGYTNFYIAFWKCYLFNDPNAANWDTSSATNMNMMLKDCSAFDQNISGWDIESVSNYTNFMSGVTLSTANYDATLIGWAAQDASDSEAVHFGSSTYTSGGVAAAARQSLIDDDSWTITDGGTA